MQNNDHVVCLINVSFDLLESSQIDVVPLNIKCIIYMITVKIIIHSFFTS